MHAVVEAHLRNRGLAVITIAAQLTFSACGGGGYGSGSGSYSTMSSSSSVSSSSASSSGGSFAVELQPAQIFPTPISNGSASASFAISATSGVASGTVTLSGVTATAVTINDAFAGNTGSVVLTLMHSPSNANLWSIAGGAALTANQVTDLLAGKLYVLVASSANPQGELRGQVVPSNITVVFSTLSGDQESPSVTTTASGMAAVTVNSAAKTAAVNVNTSGVNTAMGTELRTSIVGSSSLIATLVADNSTAGHWLNESVTLSAADITNFNSSRWYVNVSTPTHTSGEIRGQFGPNAPTLATLQTSIFTPICSGCHTGVGSALPGVQNFTTAAATYAATVTVASIEQSTVLRIKPGNPDDSYLVRKIEGDPSISNARMPLGGQLTPTQIDQIRAWVAAGAHNN
jgi:hypothetical protein